MGMVKMYLNAFIDSCLDSNQVVNSSSPSLWQDFLPQWIFLQVPSL